MTVNTRKYNPGFLSDDELVTSFCVRKHEFLSMIEMLRDCRGSANPHQIVIGPRGSGKTSLLLRVAAEIRRDADLSLQFLPIIFAEESYEVMSAGEFWLEALSRISVQAQDPEVAGALHMSWEDLRTVHDDQTLGDRCLGALLDFADQENKRLVLMVENLNTMFADMTDAEGAGWRLRKTLQMEPRILLLASATCRFDAIDNHDHALYELFRVITLRPLETEECAVLWESVSGLHRETEVIRALQILTGGNPRLLTILARFGAQLSFRELMAELLDLVDDHTEYFKSHLEVLPVQERRVYLALAALWKPATAREIADRARLDSSTCSAQLGRLVDRGTVEIAGGTPRRKLYYLTERLYNIYYLMRRASGPDPLIEALVHFMASYYTPVQLKVFGTQLASEVTDLDAAGLQLNRSAFTQLVLQPAVAPFRKELLELAPPEFSETIHQASISGKISADIGENLTAKDKAISQQGDEEKLDLREHTLETLFSKAIALSELNRWEEAVSAWDEVVSRYGDSEDQGLVRSVATALVGKGSALIGTGGRRRCLPGMRWFPDMGTVRVKVAERCSRLFYRGSALDRLNRSQEAVAAYKEIKHRFGARGGPARQELVDRTLLNWAKIELRRGQLDLSIRLVSEVLDRTGEGPSEHRILGHLIRALAMADPSNASCRSREVEAALAVCPEKETFLKEIFDLLTILSVDLGPDQMREIILASPMADLLLPLTTALEREMGLSPRVALEVQEIAEDIQQDLAKLREDATVTTE